MGISDGLQESGGCDVDCSAGTIVWVRRRNGSWWPGKILGNDELPASLLTSPRSGTPVKLLGREDASVDWYNLEKSKRVKAFRCGEFDDCIDKTEKLQGSSIRKREKYARREDAILHALELERQQLVKQQKKKVNANRSRSKKAIVQKKELGASAEHLGDDDRKIVNLRSQSLTKGLDSSVKEESTLYGQRGKNGKQSSANKDKSEAIPRMRDLQDFGLRIAPKRKASASIVSEGSQKPNSVDNHVPEVLSGSRSLAVAGPVTGNKNLRGLKRKRTQGGVIEESLVKRRDRRRPLVQVLQSSAKLLANHNIQPDEDNSPSIEGEKEQSGVVCRAKRSRCVYLPSESNGDRTECHSDEMRISSSHVGTDSCHHSSGSSTDENTTSDEEESGCSRRGYIDPEMDKEMAVLPDLIQTQPITGPNNGSIQGKIESTNTEEADEAFLVNGYMSCHDSLDQKVPAAATTDVAVSKWQLKGKRNIRNLLKRPVGMVVNRSTGAIQETYLDGKGNWSNQSDLEQQSRYHGIDASGYAYDEDELLEKNPMYKHLPGFGNRRYPLLLKGVSENSDGSNTDSEEDSVWETEGLSQATAGGYWDESDECYDPRFTGYRPGNGKASMLVDVDLQVQRPIYQGERVPLLSLMSRLNGKAIIGHQVPVEVLEDGYSDIFFATNNDFSEEPIDNDGSTTLTPVWRTARRTTMHRIPRPHPSTALIGNEASDPLQYMDLDNKTPYYRSHALHPGQMAGKSSDVSRLMEKKCPKKSIKRVSMSNQKTRTLSSIAVDQKSNGKGGSRKVVNRSGLDGLIKAEDCPTTVTCIPVKLVFSRLLEAVGRPPSRPTTHVVSIDGDRERKQLKDLL
ncbi:Tudor/PWWP/MBT superfamily protein [Thalictrum thalictroides]|uniref:Tudor/PWWP/MBT superfamily protein n=1 Tax=Thalictrum thalictroides TaxID=46969 RepID=A0A7J6W076_THATH|nr:Tudor/PWWP/MBT superfamily protein [Thalictrum thalictroides]